MKVAMLEPQTCPGGIKLFFLYKYFFWLKKEQQQQQLFGTWFWVKLFQIIPVNIYHILGVYL